MNLPPQSQLTDAKYNEIIKLIRDLNVNLNEIEEKFIHGGGKGGQKINKTASAVQLIHRPTNTVIRYQHYRERSMNRILALRELLYKLSPDSKRQRAIEKIRKQKKRRKRKTVLRKEQQL